MHCITMNIVNIISHLEKKNYEGGYTLETARGNEALNEADLNLRYIKNIFKNEYI